MSKCSTCFVEPGLVEKRILVGDQLADRPREAVFVERFLTLPCEARTNFLELWQHSTDSLREPGLDQIFNILVGQKTSISTHNAPEADCDFLKVCDLLR